MPSGSRPLLPLALGVVLALAGCGADLRGVGGPDFDSDGIAVSGIYPGFYPRSEAGSCSITAGTGPRTLTFATKESKNLVPQILVSLPDYRGPGVYLAGPPAPAGPSPLGVAQITARLGNQLHWEATAGSVTIEALGAHDARGGLTAQLRELDSDGFGDRLVQAAGRWTCGLTTAG